jgi:hypothetical protein
MRKPESANPAPFTDGIEQRQNRSAVRAAAIVIGEDPEDGEGTNSIERGKSRFEVDRCKKTFLGRHDA